MDNSNNISQILTRFSRVYLGDSLIQLIQLDIAHSQVSIFCSSAVILKNTREADIFDPARRHEPAKLTFDGVKSISCPEGQFYLNSTIVDFDAKPAEGETLIIFRLEMTGGFDNDSFMRSLTILARDFSLETVQSVLVGLPTQQ